MKTPSDVYNSMQVILAHLNDLKVHLAITAPPATVSPVFGKTPQEVYQRTDHILVLVKGIAEKLRLGSFEIPAAPADPQPRDIVANTNRVIQCLQLLKRRLGIPDRTIPAKASVRISPSHVFVEAEKIITEVKRVSQVL